MSEEVLVNVEDGSIVEAPPVEKAEAPEPEAREPESDERLVQDDGDHDDEPGATGETEEEAEARRERNRQRRKENKERRKDYIESLRREISARDEILQRQAERLDVIERRTQGADIAAITSELQKATDAYNYFKTQHGHAVTNQDGETAANAMEKMYQAADRARQLQAIQNNVKQQAQRPATPPLDPRLKMHAEGWLERNSWYDPQGGNMDSVVAKSIDEALHKEGWNPTTPQYWEELDARVGKYLPHRNARKPQAPQRTNAPVAGSGRESSSQGSGNYRISADRVQALKDSGQWDDPKTRALAIKNYQEYDKKNAA
jgi:hypothetical protein